MSQRDEPARRPLRRKLSLLLAVPALGLAAAAQAAPPPRDECVVATIVSGEEAPVERLRALAGADYWVEADRDLLLCSRGGALAAGALAAAALEAGALSVAALPGVDPARLFFLKTTPDLEVAQLGRALARGGRWVVMEISASLPPGRLEGLRSAAAAGGGPGPGRVEPALFPFEPNRVLARRGSRARRGAGEALTDPQIAAFLDEIDSARWFGDVETLAAWNRWTRGPEVLAARDWLVAEFSGLEGFSVTTAEFWVPPNSWPGAWAYNVVATIPGTSRPDDWYVVGGHYDSTSDNLPDQAPGADDNASGCAGTLELARLFAAHPPDATIIFICFSGEEQGLYGSYDYVANLDPGDLAKVQGAYILDMVAYSGSTALEAIVESETLAQTWVNQLADAAADFTTLAVVVQWGAYGSDHVPFLDAGAPAALAIEYDFNPYYHTTDDLPVHLTPALAEQILRMGGGALLRLAGSSTIFADGFETNGTARWSATVP